MAEEKLPSGAPMRSPFSTFCPGFTSGCGVPPALWRRMEVAPRIEISAPPEARARYLVGAYREITEDRAALDDVLARVPDRPGRKRLAIFTWPKCAPGLAAVASAILG